MRVSAGQSTKFISILALSAALAICPRIQAQTAQCSNTTAPPSTPQNNGSTSSVSQSAQNVANAAKNLGSIFKKKPAAGSPAAAPCPSAAPSNAPGTPTPNQPNTAAAPAQPNSGQPAPAAATPSADSAPADAAPAAQGGSAPWQPPSADPASAAAAAPAGPLDSSKLPDILGVHVGAPREEVPPIYQKLQPYYLAPKGAEPILGVTWNVINPTINGDVVTVEYTMPPNKQLVYYMTRGVTYKQPISKQNFIDALRQKYGKETLDSYNGSPMLSWAFDEQGHPIPPEKNTDQKNLFGCNFIISDGTFSDQVRAYVRGETPKATFCDSIVLLYVQLGSGPNPADPVVGFQTTMIDAALLRRDVIVAGEALKTATQKQQQQDLKNANQAKPNF